MMRLEIVSHCWRYSGLLTYQLSSFLLHPPRTTEVDVAIYCAPPPDDPDTWRVLDFFSGQPCPPEVRFHWRVLPTGHLFRRAIGRNQAALATTADWIWFADCDMVFRGETLDRLPDVCGRATGPLLYPEAIRIQQSHSLGDAAIRLATETLDLQDIDEREFEPQRYNRAIGGSQIVPGSVARNVGYCPGSRWQVPLQRWQRCREDRYFRMSLGTRGEAVILDPLYRLRHSRRGADTEDVRN